MPFYPALPEYHPSTVTPVSALLGGITAGTQEASAFQQQAIRQEALQEVKQKQAAQKQWAQSGDPAALMAAAPDLYFKANDEQRKVMDSAMEDAQRESAFVNPETYPGWRQNFIQRHAAKNASFGQALNYMLPPADKMKTPDDVRKFTTTLADVQNQIKTREYEGKVGAETKGLQERYKTITTPEQVQAQKYRMQLQGQLFSQQKSLQENHQEFEKGQQDRRLKVEEEFKKAQVEGRIQEHLTTSTESYNHAIDVKALEMKKKAAEAYTGPELTEQERKIDTMVEVAKRDNLKMMKPFFDRTNTPFPYNIKDYSRTGPPLGVDPSFDNAMAKASAIPDPAKRAETTRAVINRWNQMDSKETAAPATETPAAPAAPAPAAPAAKPTPAAAPAPAPTPAPKKEETKPVETDEAKAKAMLDKAGIKISPEDTARFARLMPVLKRNKDESDEDFALRLVDVVLNMSQK